MVEVGADGEPGKAEAVVVIIEMTGKQHFYQLILFQMTFCNHYHMICILASVNETYIYSKDDRFN